MKLTSNPQAFFDKLPPRTKEDCTTHTTPLGAYNHMNQDLFLFQALSPRAKETTPSQIHTLEQDVVNHHRQTILFGAGLL